MAQPVIVQDASLVQFTQELRSAFRLPQWKYFVIVLLGLIHCDGSHTLSGIMRQVAVWASVCGLSRFLQRSPWSAEALTAARQVFFYQQMLPIIAADHAQQRQRRPTRPGRPCSTVVTGALILDDSTQVKRYAAAMEGQGRHYSSTDHGPMPGHSLFQSVYVLAGQQLPLTPQMYRQKAVCEREGVPFRSKVDLAEAVLRTFQPAADTHTHVLVDSWYTSQRVRRVVQQRGWDLTAGLKSNRRLRLVSASGQRHWVEVAEYAASLSTADFQQVGWPQQQETKLVWAHLVRTRVKKFGACQILIVKPDMQAGAAQVRFWATTRLQDTLNQVVATAALRWTIEVLFADFKELMGSDQYQVRSAQAIVRFWALGLCLYQYLDGQRAYLQQQWGRHVSLGEVRAWLRQQHQAQLLDWIFDQFQAGSTPTQVLAALQPALP